MTFSSIDMSTRMEIMDLLSRFCHAIDYDQTKEWADLFRPDAIVSAPRFGKFNGRSEIMKIPTLVAEEGQGAWRHVFNNVVIKICEDRKVYHIQAYCTVNDWRKREAAVRCWDFSATLLRTRSLQISKLEMRAVGASCESFRPSNGNLMHDTAHVSALEN